MGKLNRHATQLLHAIEQWETADDKLSAAARLFIRDLLDSDSQHGHGTHAALERLKRHLGLDRYHMPAAVLHAMHDEAADST